MAASALPLALSTVQAQESRYKLKPGATGRLCLGCHTGSKEATALPFVHTPVKAGRCADCHDPHASDHGKLLEADPSRICLRCHEKIVPKDAVSLHAPVAAGGCVTCHDPHGSKNAKLLRAPRTEQCLSCHEDVRQTVATSEFKHAPAQRDCLGCHDPHASSKNRSLLVQGVPEACVRCHNPAVPIFAKAHVGYPVAKAQCTSCHDPHGSKNRGLLWQSVHQPVAAKMCAQCHEAASSPSALKTRRSGPDLCRGCHNELVNETFTKARIHWPVADQSGCGHCHNPHASKTAKLLSSPQKTLCGSCHADAVARQERSQTKHPPIADGDCSTCHAPHASDNRFLLTSGDTGELCGACHDWQKHSMHPIGDKVVDQRNRNLTVDCLSCHRTHGTPFPHLAHFDPKSELCVQCHTSLSR